ncbi:hypothetical protein GJAV_G00187400 [Gymnothorax javanicus]|nr:hypothetical protein GJAV_G00187400 [Gymnothorax javanicus]
MRSARFHREECTQSMLSQRRAASEHVAFASLRYCACLALQQKPCSISEGGLYRMENWVDKDAHLHSCSKKTQSRSSTMSILKIHAREIFDSRGNPTVEVDLYTKKGVVRLQELLVGLWWVGGWGGVCIQKRN